MIHFLLSFLNLMLLIYLTSRKYKFRLVVLVASQDGRFTIFGWSPSKSYGTCRLYWGALLL